MTTKLAAPELEDETAVSPQRTGLTIEADSQAARLIRHQTMPSLASEEYSLLYLPTMLGVFTARHQQMPKSNELLHEHVFGSRGYAGCEACREETEFLVAHQKKFF
ncbi:MAG TPA: hypothetical protein VGR55_05210 [Candidatus Acidoferrum sp.]|nr:hypothetical protein [Candidatus Acidoferrum sp.]